MVKDEVVSKGQSAGNPSSGKRAGFDKVEALMASAVLSDAVQSFGKK